MEGQAHILVVDDDRRLRELLRRYLAERGYRVSVAADAAEARASLKGLEFDLVVLDVMMPGESGLAFTRAFRQESDAPVLLLTAMGEAQDRIAGLEAGADDYLAKPFEPRELLLRIEAILRRGGRRPAPAGPLRLGEYSFDLARGELKRGDDTVRLTASEAELLRVFARRPGVTISREELSRAAGDPGSRAVDVQVTRLRRKIEPDPRAPRYLQTVWGQGYVLWPD